MYINDLPYLQVTESDTDSMHPDYVNNEGDKENAASVPKMEECIAWIGLIPTPMGSSLI